MLDAFDVFADVLVGTGLAPDERALIEPSLERITGRMSSKASKRLQTWVDPLCVLGGFALFGVRVLANQPRQAPSMPVERRGDERAGRDERRTASEDPRPAYSPPTQIANLLKGDEDAD